MVNHLRYVTVFFTAVSFLSYAMQPEHIAGHMVCSDEWHAVYVPTKTTYFQQGSVKDCYEMRSMPERLAFLNNRNIVALSKAPKDIHNLISVYDVWQQQGTSINKKNTLLQLKHDGARIIATNQSHQNVITGSQDGTMHIFDVRRGADPIRTYFQTFGPVQRIIASPEGTHLGIINASDGGSLCVVDSRTYQLLAVVKTPRRASVYDASFHSTESKLVYTTDRISNKGLGEPLRIRELSFDKHPLLKEIHVNSIGRCRKPVVTFKPHTDMVLCGASALWGNGSFYKISSELRVGQAEHVAGTWATLQFDSKGEHLLSMMRKDKQQLKLKVMQGAQKVTSLFVQKSNFPATVLAPNGLYMVSACGGQFVIIPSHPSAKKSS